MDKSSFHELCDLLRPTMQRRDTNFRRALPVEIKVAIGLYRLASEHSPYRTIREILGVSNLGRAPSSELVHIPPLMDSQHVCPAAWWYSSAPSREVEEEA